MMPEEQAKRIGEAWETLPNRPKRQVCLHAVEPDGRVDDFSLGAHAPKLADDDVELIHRLWLEATKENGLDGLHHREIVTLALARLAEEMKGKGRKQMIERMCALLNKRRRREEKEVAKGNELRERSSE